MYRTLALSTELPQASNRASAHTLIDGVLTVIPYGNIDNLAPAGSISSSIIDMSHWVGALLEGGRYAGKEILPPAVISRTREPLSIEGRRPSTSWGVRRHYALYGMGWELSDYDGRELVSHTGGVNGFVTAVTLVPEENLGIIVLTNTDQNGLYVALMRQILDAYLGLPYHDYSAGISQNFKRAQSEEAAQYQAFKDTIAANPATALPLKAYAGNYRNDVYGRMTINVTGNYLEAAFEHHPNLRGKLEPLGGHRFLMSFSDPIFGRKPVAFAGNGKKVVRFTLQLADFVEFTTYDFERVGD